MAGKTRPDLQIPSGRGGTRGSVDRESASGLGDGTDWAAK